jgi:hypothetical protein
MTDLSNYYGYLKIAEGIYADPLRRDGHSLEAIVQQVCSHPFIPNRMPVN